jgi:hypothetical protein
MITILMQLRFVPVTRLGYSCQGPSCERFTSRKHRYKSVFHHSLVSGLIVSCLFTYWYTIDHKFRPVLSSCSDFHLRPPFLSERYAILISTYLAFGKRAITTHFFDWIFKNLWGPGKEEVLSTPLHVMRGDWKGTREDPGTNRSSTSLCELWEAIEWGGLSDETRKTEAPCYSCCGTINMPPCSKALSVEHGPKFCSLHRYWWRLHISEIFLSVR